MIITYDEITNHPTIKLDTDDLVKLHQGDHLFSYDDGICVIMYEDKIHILSEIPECTLLKPHGRVVK